MGQRKCFNMDKGWKFHLGDVKLDPAKDGSTTCNAAKSESARGAAAHGYYDADWEIVHLPHDYAVQGTPKEEGNSALGYLTRGAAWYRKSFLLDDEDEGKQLSLRFDGIAGNAVVWVNGHLLHRNFDSFNDFTVDITAAARFGGIPNVIAVLIDTEKYHMPEEMIEGWWYDGAGIYRHVWLVKTEKVHIAEHGIFANPVKESEGYRIPVRAEVENDGEEPVQAEVQAVLQDWDNQVLASQEVTTEIMSFEKNVVTMEINGLKDVALWDVDDPNLYTVSVTVTVKGEITDQVDTEVGFRSFSFDPDKGFFLNGRPLKIKGTSNHQDHGALGSGVPDSVMELRIARLKEMGCNAYRCAHNPVAPEVLRLCDHYGLLVMSENRWFVPGEMNKELLRRLVRRERNHPSIIAWSVGNEEPLQCGESRGTKIAAELIREVKKLDSTRPCTLACNGGYFEKGAVEQCDMVSMNYFPWLYDEVHKLYPEKSIIASEASCSNNCRGVYKADEEKRRFTAYDHHAPSFGNTHRQAWKYVAERDFVSGIFYWTGYEYRGETMWPSLFGEVGMLDFNGFPKDNYYLMQALWKEEPAVHITPHWNFKEGESVRVYVYTNGDSAELFLNGRSLGKKVVDPYEQVCWQVEYEPGTLSVIVFKDEKEWASTAVSTTKEAVKLVIEEEAQKNRKGIYHDLVRMYRIYAVDEEGKMVPDAECEIQMDFAGEIEYLGAGSSPIDPTPVKRMARTMVHGLMQVIVRGGEYAPGTFRVSSEGLEGTEIQISPEREEGVGAVVHYGLLTRWWSSVVFDTPRTPDTYKYRMPSEAGMPLALFSHQTGYAMLSLATILPQCPKEKKISICFDEITGEAEIWIRKRSCSYLNHGQDEDMLKENSVKKKVEETGCCVDGCPNPCQIYVKKEGSQKGSVKVEISNEMFDPGESITIWAGIKGEHDGCGLTGFVRWSVED